MKRRILDGDFLDRLDAATLLLKNPMTGFFGGSRRARSYGNTVEFADFREYFPGDDIRRIDWNVYARFEKYFIRLFTDERQMHNQILVDCSASMACGEPEKAEQALRIAAAFGYLSVSAMDRVSYKLLKGEKAEDIMVRMVELSTDFDFMHMKTMYNERQYLIFAGYGIEPNYTNVQFTDYINRFISLVFNDKQEGKRDSDNKDAAA
jgi:hypothetical protein